MDRAQERAGEGQGGASAGGARDPRDVAEGRGGDAGGGADSDASVAGGAGGGAGARHDRNDGYARVQPRDARRAGFQPRHARDARDARYARRAHDDDDAGDAVDDDPARRRRADAARARPGHSCARPAARLRRRRFATRQLPAAIRGSVRGRVRRMAPVTRDANGARVPRRGARGQVVGRRPARARGQRRERRARVVRGFRLPSRRVARDCVDVAAEDLARRGDRGRPRVRRGRVRRAGVPRPRGGVPTGSAGG
mmetsp:Transcript_14213/g.61893  ORF Transcript_14213/g.61893 Transcript_14213/m.61893 type:complete len:254 (+) Transcript_14213:560-1321(+)